VSSRAESTMELTMSAIPAAVLVRPLRGLTGLAELADLVGRAGGIANAPGVAAVAAVPAVGLAGRRDAELPEQIADEVAG